jgi:hypothetical protein
MRDQHNQRDDGLSGKKVRELVRWLWIKEVSFDLFEYPLRSSNPCRWQAGCAQRRSECVTFLSGLNLPETMPAELESIQPQVFFRVAADLGSGVQGAVALINLKVARVHVFFARITKPKAGSSLLRRRPNLALERVTQSTGIVEVGVGEH